MTHTPTPWYRDTTYQWPTKIRSKVHSERWICDPASGKADPDLQMAFENSRRIVACVNFFHGQDIPTENISESGFWVQVDYLDMCRKALYRIQNEGDAHSNAVATEALTRLGVEP